MNIIHLLYMGKQTYTDKIQKLYDNLKYNDVYGGTVLLFVIITILLFLVVSYCYVITHVSSIKKNWVTERCKPYIIPFAGLINKPPNMTKEEYTEQNFTYCAQNMLKDMSSFILEPITFIVASFEGVGVILEEDLQNIRAMINNYRNNLFNSINSLFSQIFNLLTPLQILILKFGDLTGKIQGSMTAGLYALIGSYMSFQTFLDICAHVVAVIMIILSALLIYLIAPIIPLFLSVVGIPAALELLGIVLPLIITYVALMIPLIITITVLEDDLGATIDWGLPPPPPAPPSAPPSCFDKNTFIKMNDGSTKIISNIEVGDKLLNNNVVTAKMKLSALNVKMYNFNNIIVSGTHSVKINGEWIEIEDHVNSEIIDNYNEEFIYCLNTESKVIEINDYVFCDWDELFDEDINKIEKIYNVNKYETNNENNNGFNNSDIHKYFDGGFIGNTKIALFDETEKDIKDIKIGDILKNGEKVYGLVEIDGKNVNSQYSYNLGKLNVKITGGPNINLCDKNIFFTSTLNLDEKTKMNIKEDKLYHLLTDKKTFYISNLRFYDYNASVEIFLEKYRVKLLSMKYV